MYLFQSMDSSLGLERPHVDDKGYSLDGEGLSGYKTSKPDCGPLCMACLESAKLLAYEKPLI